MREKEPRRIKSKRKLTMFIISMICFLSFLFLGFSIYLISGIETKLRYIAIIILLIINIILFILSRKFLKKGSVSAFIVFISITALLTIGQAFIGYFVFSTYSKLDNLNKNKVTYSTSVVVLSDSNISKISGLNEKEIGIVKDETSIDGYIIGLEIIEENNLQDTSTIIEYEDSASLMADLYSKKIDAIIISSSYPSMFKNIDDYDNISKDTDSIFEKEKTLTKTQIAEYTGEEIKNYSKSDILSEPFTILIMGIDSTVETLSENASGNGDALMLVTFNPKTLNSTILSIPRDSYVPIACFANKKENKITHAAWNGETCMSNTIENFTGIDIDYYVKINFKGVVKLVDALGGVEVDVPVTFCEQNSDRSWASGNKICLKKGVQTLTGEEALALARHRKTLATGDLQRGTDQQLVVQGILNKLKTITSASQLLEVLDTISNSMDTNFSTKQILSFYDIAKNLLETSTSDNLINIQQLFLSGTGQMIYDESMGMILWDYIINDSSLKQVVTSMKINLGIKKPTLIKTMNFSIKDTYEMKIIGKDVTSSTKLYTLLPNFVGESETYAKNWLNSHDIDVVIVTKDVKTGYDDGEVISQSLHKSKRIDLISGSITLTVANKVTSSPTTDTTDTTINDETNTTTEN